MDLQIDQTLGDLGFAWRVIATPRGYLDLIGGVHYNNYKQHAALQANDERIAAFAGQLANAGTLLQLARELLILSGRNPTLPVAPLTGTQVELLTKAIAKIKGNTAEHKTKIANLLHNTLNRSFSRTDEWFDPYVGLRGRYNLNEKFYLTAKGDIGYRALGVDYSKDIFAMDTATHGVQATLGFTFLRRAMRNANLRVRGRRKSRYKGSSLVMVAASLREAVSSLVFFNSPNDKIYLINHP